MKIRILEFAVFILIAGMTLTGCGTYSDSAIETATVPAVAADTVIESDTMEKSYEAPSEEENEEDEIGGPLQNEDIFIQILDDYTDVIENKDASKLMELMQVKVWTYTVTEMLKDQFGKEVSEDDIIEFYGFFYQNELSALYDSLYEEYGNFKVEYETGSLGYQSTETISEANDILERYGAEDIEIQDHAIMEVQFYVTNGIKRDALSYNFLSSAINFLKVDDKWGIGISDEFPEPNLEILKSFYGLSTTSEANEKTQGYTNEELCNMATLYYTEQYSHMPSHADIDGEEGDIVRIHLYDVTNGHTATIDWYEVNRYTAKGTNFFGEEIDLTLSTDNM